MIKSKIRGIIRSFRNGINKGANYFSIGQLFICSFNSIKQDKILLVSIVDFNHGRYGFQLINYFSKGGYYIIFFKSQKFLSKLFGYDRLIFQLPSVSIWRSGRNLKGKTISWLKFNFNQEIVLPINIEKEIKIDLNYFNTKPDQVTSFKLPFYIHPLMNKYIATEKDIKKQNRILFYGQSDLYYDSKWIKEHFNLISRKEVYDYIQDSNIPFIAPKSYEELLENIDDSEHRNALFIIDSNQVWIPAAHWINLLRRFDFFIATPGVCMPLSHNAIEALSQFTIPILQYPCHFTPILMHLNNCIVYRDLIELKEQIFYCLFLNREKIDEMQQNVKQYFKEYIEPVSFLKKIEQNNETKIRLYFNAEEFSLCLINNNE